MKVDKNFNIPVDDYMIVADWYKEDNKNTAILLMHGYPAVKANQIDFATNIVKLTGLSMLTFDYSGLGESQYKLEDTTPRQHLKDSIASYDWLRNKGFNNIICIGTSYGGYLAAHIWKHRPVNKLILRTPAINPVEYFDFTRSKYNREEQMALRKDKERLSKHPVITGASEYKGKTLVVVHGKDDAIPKETTDAYIKAFKADVYTQPEFVHSLGDPVNPKDKFPQYQQAIADWIINN